MRRYFLEAGWAPLCDFILFVDVPVETRLERARTVVGPTPNSPDREAAQWPIAEKRRHATHVLPNSAPRPNCAPPFAISGPKTLDRFRQSIRRSVRKLPSPVA